MPTSQKVQIDTYDFGASLTAPTLAALATGTTITDGTASTCNEQTADAGVYIADFVGADASHLIPAGTYRLRTTVNGKPLKRFVTFTGVDGELVYARAERAVELDSATQTILNDIPTTAEFEARTIAAANYATASQINSLQVNTRASVQVPVEIETPDSGTQIWKIRLFLFDSEGNMETPDSTPTVALVNASGTDRSSRLSSATTISTGAYSWDYTSTDDDTEEQLNWTFTVVEGGLTRIYPATSYVVEETAYRFTSTDRSTLNSRSSQTDVTTVGTAVAAVSTKLGTPAGASVSADIASVKTDTGTTIPDLIGDIGGGAGTGARTVTITVNDGASPLQNAVVRLTEGANTFTSTTNASGVIDPPFNVDDATYVVSISKAGYSYGGTTLVVDGTETRTYSMSAISITPSAGNFTTCYQTVYDKDGNIAPNQTVKLQVVRAGSTDVGRAYGQGHRTAVSGVDGVVEWLNVPKGSEIYNWIGSKKNSTTYTVPLTADSTHPLPSIVGET
jgi:hypothetical protein